MSYYMLITSILSFLTSSSSKIGKLTKVFASITIVVSIINIRLEKISKKLDNVTNNEIE